MTIRSSIDEVSRLGSIDARTSLVLGSIMDVWRFSIFTIIVLHHEVPSLFVSFSWFSTVDVPIVETETCVEETFTAKVIAVFASTFLSWISVLIVPEVFSSGSETIYIAPSFSTTSKAGSFRSAGYVHLGATISMVDVFILFRFEEVFPIP